jgi:2,3-bisphosphoglycerate-dependent phosphoglycerate mutase
VTTFYLVRHAHAGWSPDEGRPLSPRGQGDARRFAEILGDRPIRQIYSSPYRRALETVEPLAARLDLPVRVELDLRERALGQIPTGGDFLAAVERTWKEPSFAHPGGESNAAAQRRGVAVLQKLQKQHPNDHLILSTHGNLLALLLQHFDPRVDFILWKSLTMPDLYELQVNSGRGIFTRL